VPDLSFVKIFDNRKKIFSLTFYFEENPFFIPFY